MGEIATPVCFRAGQTTEAPSAANRARKSLPQLPRIEGVGQRVEIAGAGYVNFCTFSRAAFLTAAIDGAESVLAAAAADTPKCIVEHTNIKTNKAAHIGHLRNAARGDTLVRVLRHTGPRVEVQNYIDNTGVQVADVVIAFLHIARENSRGSPRTGGAA